MNLKMCNEFYRLCVDSRRFSCCFYLCVIRFEFKMFSFFRALIFFVWFDFMAVPWSARKNIFVVAIRSIMFRNVFIPILCFWLRTISCSFVISLFENKNSVYASCIHPYRWTFLFGWKKFHIFKNYAYQHNY